MPAAIPASALVNVVPGVIAAGGTAVAMSGLILTANPRVPIGSVLSFTTPATVAAYFGATSQEASMATVYFAAYDTKTATPGALLFAQYPQAAVAGYLRGGNVANALTLAQLQALSGTLTVTVDGTSHTSGVIVLSAATSYSNAATIIQAGFTALGATVTFDSTSGAFVFTSATTGATSNVSFASGTLAAPLLLTAATGAVTSVGAVAATPATAMAGVTAISQAFTTFTTTFEPVNADKISFAAWANTQNYQYAYIMWSTDASDTTGASASSAWATIKANGYSGTFPIYEPTDLNHAAFVMGVAAAVDYNRANARITFAYKGQSGLPAGVTSATVAAQLIANSVNFYGAYATASTSFTFLQTGAVSGKFLWLDSFLNQVWLNDSLQGALLALETAVGSIPYNQDGYTLIKAAMQGPAQAGLTFGAIRAGVVLSATQIAEINAAAGLDVASVVSQVGYYIQVLDPGSTVRVARGSPIITFWYCDGQSIQNITLNSLE
ncbi:MAG: DUF3383 domain-containing protein, partial [Caulobacteraceae bacterium]